MRFLDRVSIVMDLSIHDLPQDNGQAGLQDVGSFKRRLLDYMVHIVGKDPSFASERDWYYALAYLVRGILAERLMRTARAQHENDVKRVYYLSMEYLIGRGLRKRLLDLGVGDAAREALNGLGVDLDAVAACETDAALGNGGLGRLAACYLDSLATHGYPGYGYGIRYDFGIFTQRLENGQQIEQPENWLRYGYPWDFERPSVIYPVRFNGRILCFKGGDGSRVCQWVDTDDVYAMAYDIPVSGYRSPSVSNLRLWSARSTREFDLRFFNEGHYIDAVREKTASETLSKVLYPDDATEMGQELRLKQEFFFVSASLQDIISRFRKFHDSLDLLPDKAVIQLNDTHPALAIPELMRILVDENDFGWENAWDITTRVFAYTNHTLLPEALETWPIPMLEKILPRHLEIIYEINAHFLNRVRFAFPGDPGVLGRMSLVDDSDGRIRMAHLAVVGSCKVNGVAELHSDLLRTSTFADFHRLDPGKFVNVTNGITPRRWLLQANPGLAALISECLGDEWRRALDHLRGLTEFARDAAFQERFRAIKTDNKARLARLIKQQTGIDIDPTSLFDVQVKRIHEYKRQLLNVLHVISRYVRIRDGKRADVPPRTVVFSGKAAPGYFMAKLIIRLINDVAAMVNNDPLIGDRLRVAFIPNYNVSLAEIIIPGSDLSEQISTAGTEASGTGNMKFALNGAVTIGTLDGANVEILEEIGEQNMFVFGLDAGHAQELRLRGHHPRRYYDADPDLKRVLDMIGQGYFSPEEPERYQPIVNSLLEGGDRYFLLADYASYVECHDRVDAATANDADWTAMAIFNVAGMGKFSSDRAIHTYARDIWKVEPMTF